MAPASVLPGLATNAAFFVVFGVFVVAMLVLVGIVIVWAVRHDVAGRKVWRERQEAAMEAAVEAGDAGQLGPYPVPQNRLQQRANERAQQRAQQSGQQGQRQQPPGSTT